MSVNYNNVRSWELCQKVVADVCMCILSNIHSYTGKFTEGIYIKLICFASILVTLHCCTIISHIIISPVFFCQLKYLYRTVKSHFAKKLIAVFTLWWKCSWLNIIHERCVTDYRPTSYLQQLKYWQSLFGPLLGSELPRFFVA